MTFQRARSKEQIEKRRDDVIKSTVELFDKDGLEKLNLSAISKQTGLTRPTIYNYFKTKEEILIQAIIQEIRKWATELIGEFKLNKIYEIDSIAEIWAETLSHYPIFLELHSILHTVLERNCSVEILAQFKKDIITELMPIWNLMIQLFPEASQEELYTFMINQLTSAIGLFPMSHVSEEQQKAIELSKTGYQVPDFKQQYKQAVYQHLYCLKHHVSLKK